jgi:hypothetical protein
VNLSDLNRPSLIIAGALLALSAAGCSTSRGQAASDPSPGPPYGAALQNNSPPAAFPGSASGAAVPRGDLRPAPVSQYDGRNNAPRYRSPFPPNDENQSDAVGPLLDVPFDSEVNEASAVRKLSAFATLRARLAERRHKSSVNQNQYAGSSPAAANSRAGALSGTAQGAPNGSRVAQDNRRVGNRSLLAAGQERRLVTLSPPNDHPDTSAADSQRSIPLPVDNRQLASPARGASATASWTTVRSQESPSVPAAKRPDADDLGREPIRLVDPPALRTPPVDGGYDVGAGANRGLEIPRLQTCRQVRGYEDVVAIDPQRLRRGQPLLLYATLENFRSMATSKGYRTLTLSTLEIRSPDGELLQRQPLGTAVDLVDIPRREFFLTHLMTVPDDLLPGDYLIDLFVDDLLKHESARARIAVKVMEDRIPRDGTADNVKYATHPESFPR